MYSINCINNGLLYVATIADETVTMVYYDESYEHIEEPMKIIASKAIAMGIKRIAVYLDVQTQGQVDIMEEHDLNFYAVWTDGRFVRYECELRA